MSNTNNSHVSPTSIIESAPTQGFFELTFSNSKKHGLKPIQTHHCLGALYSNGHCHLDTHELRRTYFETLSQMCEYLEQRMDELENRQYEFMGILRDVVDVVKRQHETLDAVIEAEGAAKSKS